MTHRKGCIPGVAPTAAERQEEGSQGKRKAKAERAAPGNSRNEDQALERATEATIHMVLAAASRVFSAGMSRLPSPGAARSASLRACPWLPSAAPPALVEWPPPSAELFLVRGVLAPDLEPPSRKSQIEQGRSTLCARVTHAALFKTAKARQRKVQ